MARAARKKGVAYMLDHWGTIAGGLVVIATVLGGTYGGITYTHDLLQSIDQNAVDIYMVGERLDSKITQDNIKGIRSRQWELEKNYNNKIDRAPAMVRDEYRRLQAEKEDLEKELQQIREDVKEKRTSK